jgi:hypothetical protein
LALFNPSLKTQSPPKKKKKKKGVEGIIQGTGLGMDKALLNPVLVQSPVLSGLGFMNSFRVASLLKLRLF